MRGSTPRGPTNYKANVVTDKKVKVEFAPGCFDNFEGTQEELDALQKEIIEKFSNLTPDEARDIGRPVDPDELSDEEMEMIQRAFANLDSRGHRLQ